MKHLMHALAQARLGLLLFVVSVLSTTLAQAQLVLEIDTTAKTFALTGSASGIPKFAAGDYFAIWKSTPAVGDNYSFGHSPSLFEDLSSSVAVYPILYANGEFALQLQSHEYDYTGALTGSGMPHDYSFLSLAYQDAFESLIGRELVLTPNAGTGYGNISVVSAVPEPSTYAALAGFAVLGLALWRRANKRRLSAALAALLLLAGAGKAQTWPYYSGTIEIGPDGTLDEVAISAPGTWTATGSDASISATASFTAAGLSIASSSSATVNDSFSGQAARVVSAGVSDVIYINSGSASGDGYAVLRFEVGEAPATNGVVLNLTLSGGGEQVHDQEYPAFDDHFSTGLVEFAAPFTFGDTGFIVGISFSGGVTYYSPVSSAAESWDFSSGATFLGVAAVYDSGYNLVTDYTISSGSGTDYAISAVPEPSTYAALTGFAVLGLTLWRRRLHE